MNPNIRTVTDLTTIPASVVQVGTLTPFVGDVLLLEYSGTAAALDAILVQAGANKDQQKTALWVWDGTSTAPFNVTSWFGKFIKVDRDASAYTGDFNLIETKLFGWEVISTGDGTGTVSGSAIGALNTISFKPITDFFVDPVVVEGNVGDNLTVLEFYNQQAGSDDGGGGGGGSWLYGDADGEFERPSFYNDFISYESPIILSGTSDSTEGVSIFGQTLSGVGLRVNAESEYGDGMTITGKSTNNGFGLTITGETTDSIKAGLELHGNNPIGGDIYIRLQNGSLSIDNLPNYADDAAAIADGLTTGRVYKTTTGGSTFLKIVP